MAVAALREAIVTDWRASIDAQIATSRRSARAPRRSTAINYTPEHFSLMLAAARGRDLSLSAFQRRAVLSFAQFDLGFDWFEAMQVETPSASYADPGNVQALAGHGHGLWRIMDLGEHS